MTVVALFAGGLYLGKVIGDAPDAGAAFITTVTETGRVIKVAGKPVRVLVPAKTIVRDGVVFTVPATTVNLTQTVAATVVSTVNNTTTVSQTVTVPDHLYRHHHGSRLDSDRGIHSDRNGDRHRHGHHHRLLQHHRARHLAPGATASR